MTAEVPDAAASALANHGAFERVDGEYAVTTTPFETTVAPAPADAEGRDADFAVVAEVPTLDAAVPSEAVAPVVEDGWFETLSLRLEDAYDVAEVDPIAGPEIERIADRVVARFEFAAWDAAAGVADAKAIVDYVEGTYVQGIVPGYEYAEPVASLVSRATQQAGGEDDGTERGGTPL